jgi:hypothetical protein
VPLVGFEPTVSAGERPQTHVLDRTALGTGFCSIKAKEIYIYIYIYIYYLEPHLIQDVSLFSVTHLCIYFWLSDHSVHTNIGITNNAIILISYENFGLVDVGHRLLEENTVLGRK